MPPRTNRPAPTSRAPSPRETGVGSELKQAWNNMLQNGPTTGNIERFDELWKAQGGVSPFGTTSSQHRDQMFSYMMRSQSARQIDTMGQMQALLRRSHLSAGLSGVWRQWSGAPPGGGNNTGGGSGGGGSGGSGGGGSSNPSTDSILKQILAVNQQQLGVLQRAFAPSPNQQAAQAAQAAARAGQTGRAGSPTASAFTPTPNPKGQQGGNAGWGGIFVGGMQHPFGLGSFITGQGFRAMGSSALRFAGGAARMAGTGIGAMAGGDLVGGAAGVIGGGLGLALGGAALGGLAVAGTLVTAYETNKAIQSIGAMQEPRNVLQATAYRLARSGGNRYSGNEPFQDITNDAKYQAKMTSLGLNAQTTLDSAAQFPITPNNYDAVRELGFAAQRQRLSSGFSGIEDQGTTFLNKWVGTMGALHRTQEPIADQMTTFGNQWSAMLTTANERGLDKSQVLRSMDQALTTLVQLGGGTSTAGAGTMSSLSRLFASNNPTPFTQSGAALSSYVQGGINVANKIGTNPAFTATLLAAPPVNDTAFRSLIGMSGKENDAKWQQLMKDPYVGKTMRGIEQAASHGRMTYVDAFRSFLQSNPDAADAFAWRVARTMQPNFDKLSPNEQEMTINNIKGQVIGTESAGQWGVSIPGKSLGSPAENAAQLRAGVLGKTGKGTSSERLFRATARQFEGFRGGAYKDINGTWHVGYGSDTMMVNGKEVPVTPGARVTTDQANADLRYRTKQSENIVIKNIGQEAWSKLSQGEQAALMDLAYNYGDNSVLGGVWKAARGGKAENIGQAILARAPDNHGIGATRRATEAALADPSLTTAAIKKRIGNLPPDNVPPDVAQQNYQNYKAGYNNAAMAFHTLAGPARLFADAIQNAAASLAGDQDQPATGSSVTNDVYSAGGMAAP